MNAELDLENVETILQSLEHSRCKFENYEGYSYEQKQARMTQVNEAMEKIRAIRDELRTNPN